jgi:Na+-transporting NADH:ubiquinone oxidoreductase subunit NqrB
MAITRRSSRWIGYFMLLLGVGLSALIGFATLDALISSGLLLLTGLLFVLAGFETPLTRRFGWHRILGLAFFTIGVYQLTNLSFGTNGAFYAIATLSLAVLFAFMGFDIARGGPHFDIDPNETV